MRRTASRMAARASCWRWPWVRSSATTCLLAGASASVSVSSGLVSNLVVCGFGQRSEEGGEFLSDVGGQSEVSGPGAVFAVCEVEEPAEAVFGFVGGQDPVGVDGFDEFGGDPVEVLVAELGGLLYEEEFAGFDGGGVAVLDLAEGGVDQGDLFGGDQAVSLRGGEVGSDGCQGFAGHAGPVGEVFGGPDSAGRIPDREVERLHQHLGHGPLGQHSGHALFGAVLDDRPVHHRQLVPDPSRVTAACRPVRTLRDHRGRRRRRA